MVFKRGSFRIGAMLAACVAGALTLVGAPAAQAETLRVCADPDNMPFSSESGERRGIYIEVAEKVAARLSMDVEYVWWLTYYSRRALRNTLLKNDCDAVFALPAGKGWGMRGLKRSNEFLHYSYALIAPKGLHVSQLADLKGKRIGVQFQTNPHVLLSSLEGYDMHTSRTAEEVLAALHEGAIDVAFLWGPVAGYELARQAGGERWQVVPLAGAEVEGSVGVAVRSDNLPLLEKINAALAELAPEIATIARSYGMPQGEAVHFAEFGLPYGPGHGRPDQAPAKTAAAAGQAGAVQPAAPVVVAQADTAKVATTAAEAKPAADAQDDASMAAAGRVKFNDVCSHCHATDGASPIRARDLRRLNGRYPDEWVDVARTTINEGRPDYGMPTWKDVLSGSQIEEIIAFLKTIQNN
ncbi:MAG: transporter substrate-binding domain-containing protein [Burkholderiaceae bacterium]